MKNNRILILVAGCALAGLTGCVTPGGGARPVAHESSTDAFLERYHNASIVQGARFAILMRGEKMSDSLLTFMTAELKEAGFGVKSPGLAELLPEAIAGKIRAGERYSFTEAAVRALAAPGENGERARAAAVEEAAKNLAGSTELREEDGRLNDMGKYLDDFGALLRKLDIDYVMTVQQSNAYSYYVEIINPRTFTVEGVYYLSANREGWNKRMPQLRDVPGRNISPMVSEGESPRYLEMQYANYLVNLMTGRSR